MKKTMYIKKEDIEKMKSIKPLSRSGDAPYETLMTWLYNKAGVKWLDNIKWYKVEMKITEIKDNKEVK